MLAMLDLSVFMHRPVWNRETENKNPMPIVASDFASRSGR
jgi:hypothetical protein